jgi:hypothetical protein
MRQADVPFDVGPIPQMKPQEAFMMDRLNQVRDMPGMGAMSDMGQIMDLMAGLKGMPQDVLEPLLGKLMGVDPLAQKKDLETFKHGLGAEERKQKQASLDQNRDILATQREQNRLARESLNRVPYAKAIENMVNAYASGIEDPVALNEIANQMGWAYTGGTTSRPSVAGMAVPFSARTLNPRLGPMRPASPYVKATDKQKSQAMMQPKGQSVPQGKEQVISRAKELAAKAGVDINKISPQEASVFVKMAQEGR